jgi:hypothetical protein
MLIAKGRLTFRSASSVVFLIILLVTGCEKDEASIDSLPPPPRSLGLDSFYQKYLNASGIPIISSAKVPDKALYNAKKVVDEMVLFRQDVLVKLIDHKISVGIMSTSEVITDMPEFHDLYIAFPGNVRTPVGSVCRRKCFMLRPYIGSPFQFGHTGARICTWNTLSGPEVYRC